MITPWLGHPATSLTLSGPMKLFSVISNQKYSGEQTDGQRDRQAQTQANNKANQLVTDKLHVLSTIFKSLPHCLADWRLSLHGKKKVAMQYTCIFQ